MERSLWEKSGHWAKYASHNYAGKTLDGKDFCVKPMSCPGGMLVFAQGIKSYKDLPMYLAEFGKVNRYEASGALAGLMRVRELTQDDAHIFCTEDQMQEEVIKALNLVMEIYRKLGFTKILFDLETRPDSEFRIGSDEVWDFAEDTLRKSLDAAGVEYIIAEGEGAFYGPKICAYLWDAIGRKWQCGTVQLDMNLPERFDLSYIGEDGEKHRPIMLHRAILGSIERFMGILLESTAGNLPLWLSPEPVVVVPVSEKYRDYAEKVVADLRMAGIYTRADLRDEKVNYKVRDLSLAKTPIIAVVGEKEMKDNTVTLRRLGKEGQEIKKLDVFVDEMKEAVKLPL